MWVTRVFVLFVSVGAIRAADKETKKKNQGNLKRAVDSYSYPLPAVQFDDAKSGNTKTKVIVETIKSISPPEYLPPDGYVNSPIESNVQGLQVPGASVSFNAFEPEAGKKSTTGSLPSTVTATPSKKKPGGLGTYRYYGGSGPVSSSVSTSQPSSTISPAPVRTTSVEPATTLPPGYQYTSRPASTSQAVSPSQKAIKIGGSKLKSNGYSYSPAKIVKKPTRLEPKHADSKPEETGFNGYHYDVGSLNYEAPVKHAGPQPGMMGLSYMRSSSPYYNYHVMLD